MEASQVDTALHSLRDIQGVLGSFLLDELGRVLARDMPSVFDEHTLSQASLRLSQLRGAFETGKEGFEGCTARFGGHLLVLRAAEARTLCVLCPVGTNLSTLTMGINLVSRRVSAPRRPLSIPPLQPTATPASVPPPKAASAPIMAPIGASVVSPAPRPAPHEESRESIPPEPMSTTRFFRGRPVP